MRLGKYSVRRFGCLAISALLVSNPACAQNNTQSLSPEQLAQSLGTINTWVNNTYAQLDGRLRGAPKTAVENLQKLWLQGRNVSCGIGIDPADQGKWLAQAMSDPAIAACALTDTYDQAFRLKSIYA